MKKHFYVYLFLLLCYSVNGQNVPNGGFENWLNFSGYSTPVSWNTTDSVASVYGQRSVLKETSIVHSGASAMKMQSWVYSFIATEPGVATNGRLNTSTLELEGGTPDSTRHDVLSGWYIYYPSEGDTCAVYVLLTKWNGTTRDTIGQGLWSSGDTASSYNQFNIYINYTRAGNPDTVLLVIASAPIGISTAHAGTILYIDDLSFSGVNSTNDLPLKSYSVNAYPNPASDFLSIETKGNMPLKGSVSILNINGKFLESIAMIDNKQRIDIRSYSNGNYFYELLDEKERVLYSGKFSIIH